MALPHAILGFLTFQPMTGYDLKTQCFDKSVRYFWSADQAQIYRTLEKLLSEGHITSTLEVQDGKPNRKVYSLTPSGREVLDRWLREPQGLPVHREPFLMQLYFAGELSNAEILQQLQYQKQQHEERLQEYREIEAYFERQFQEWPDHPERRSFQLQRLTLQFGIRLEEMYLDWLEHATQTIEGLEEP